MSDDARFTPITWPIYCQGYHAALSAAVRVLVLAVRRRRTREQIRRRAAQLERAQLAAGADDQVARVSQNQVSQRATRRSSDRWYSNQLPAFLARRLRRRQV